MTGASTNIPCGDPQQLIETSQQTSQSMGMSPETAQQLRQELEMRAQTEALLRHELATHRAIAEATPDLIWSGEPDRRQDYANKRWQEYTGLKLTEAKDAGWQRPCHPHDAAMLKALWAEAIRTGIPAESECRLRRHDGEYRWFRIRVVPLQDNTGQIIKCIGIATDIHECRQADEERQQLHTLLSSLAEEVWFCDAEGNVHLVNPAAARAFASGRTEALLQPISVFNASLEIYNADGRPRDPQDAPLLRSLRGEIVWDLDEIVRDPKTGQLRWRQVNSVPCRDKSGRIIGAIATVRDITERKRAEEALRDSEERFRIAADAAHVMIYDVWLDSGTVVLMHGLENLLGYRPDEVPLKRRWWFSQIHPDDIASCEANLHEVMEHGKDHALSYRIRHKMGHYITVEDTGRTLRGEDGRPVRLIGGVADITERKRHEEQITRLNQDLQRKVSELETLFRVVPIGIAVADDRECRFIRVNPTAVQVLGLPHPEANASLSASAGKDPPPYRCMKNGRVLPPEELPMQVAASTGRPVHKAELDFLLADGRIRNAICNVAPLLDEHGNSVGAVGAFWDISDLKKVEEQLTQAKEAAEEANRTKDQFLAVLSHELRTPLTPVLAMAQIMELDPQMPPNLREAISMIRRNIELEARLVDDLLDLNRILRGKLELHFTTVDLHKKVRQVVQICDSDMHARQLSLTMELNALQHHVHADAARLQQVIWNLLKNAIKFTPAGGSITIRTENPNHGHIALTVQDTGVGIEPDVLPRLFDAFEQGGKDVTRQFGGLGLGLSICKGIVDLHGGQLLAASDGRGKGATFRLELRTSRIEASSGQHLSFEQRGIDLGAGGRVLLVEDHPDTAKTMALLLRSYGYSVRVATSLASAIQAVEAEQFDLLISDLGLPDGSGLDLMRQLRQKYPIKGIAVSGFGMEEDVRKSKEAGFLVHLTKPIALENLEKALRKICN